LIRNDDKTIPTDCKRRQNSPKRRAESAKQNSPGQRPGAEVANSNQALKGRNKMPQSLANILIHAIWSTKERRSLISDEMRPGLHGYLAGILKNLESPALIINSVADHIHVLCQLSKNLPACKLVEEVKKNSSKWMKENGVREFSWQSGYGVFSVSESNAGAVREYIAGQPEHHKKGTLRTSFANFAKNITSLWMNDMCGIDFVPPFQGLSSFGSLFSQGVALGCLVVRFQRVSGEIVGPRKNSRC
jgi:putative transposase